MNTKMKTDPTTRRNGRCRQCGERRPRVAVLAADPFCSSRCCTKWHGVKSTLDVRQQYV